MSRIRAYWRFIVVARAFLPLLLTYARDRRKYLLFGGKREVTEEMQVDRAATLLETLIELGPTFIKLGQVLSTRPDALPSAYIEQLTKLQDRVPPADWEETKAVIEEDLGGSIDELFDDFDEKAVSGASLGQVYFAEIDGREVAVKVRRPGVEQQVEVDLQVIDWGLPIILRFVDDARAFSMETLADEFSSTIKEEMDYARERDMLIEIRDNLSHMDDIRVPEPIDGYASERIVTMEYIDGMKIDDVEAIEDAGINRTRLAERLQEAYMQMIIEDGLFHADPHPGNLAIKQDGTIVFYDFGMTGTISEQTQRHIIDFYVGIARDDIDRVLDALVAMDVLDENADRKLMGRVLQLAIQEARGEAVDQYEVEKIVDQIQDKIYEFPFRLPPDFALLVRVTTITNGICLRLDSDFNFIKVATQYLKDSGYIEDQIKERLNRQRENAQESVTAALRTPPKLERTVETINSGDLEATVALSDETNTIERLGKQLILGMLTTGLLISTTILYVNSLPMIAAGAAVVTFVTFLLLYRSF